MTKLASALCLAIAFAMCALGVWAFVTDPFFYAADNGSGGGSRVEGRYVIPIFAALVAVFALRSLPPREH